MCSPGWQQGGTSLDPIQGWMIYSVPRSTLCLLYSLAPYDHASPPINITWTMVLLCLGLQGTTLKKYGEHRTDLSVEP
jgi:hypothetical protein